jgi:2-oxoglutarate ferredoxin oxidoreductase subunit gamma
MEEEKNKQERIIFAGFGGQGILTIGKILANAAFRQGQEVTHIASYGPEMRGGTCNCSVIVSDSPIGSPIISKGKADAVLAFNQPSADKFLEYLQPNGLIILNSSLIKKDYGFGSKTAVKVPLLDLAMENFQNTKPMNMICLGIYLNLKMRGIIDLEIAKEVTRCLFTEKRDGDRAKNEEIAKISCRALELGFNLDISKS